jgi:hypothetical protein
LRNDNVNLTYVGYDQITENVNTFVRGFLTFTGGLPDPTHAPVSLYGAMVAYRPVWFAAVFLLPFYWLLRIRSIHSARFQFILIYYSLIIGTTLHIYLFTATAVLGPATFRYFDIALILAVVLCGFALGEQTRQKTWMAIAVFTSLPIWAQNCYDLVRRRSMLSPTKDGRP